MSSKHIQQIIPIALTFSVFASLAQSTQELVITGSYLKRTEAETASPIQTITRRDIEQLT